MQVGLSDFSAAFVAEGHKTTDSLGALSAVDFGELPEGVCPSQ